MQQSSINSTIVTPLALKSVGIVLIFSSLIDLVFALIPYSFSDGAWQLTATSQLVDRGLLPLVGIGFLIAGDWIAIVSSEDAASRGHIGRLITFGFSTLLGIIFLLTIVFQLMGNIEIRDKSIKQINDRAAQVEKQLKNPQEQLNQELSQVETLLNNKQIPAPQIEELKKRKTQLEQLKNNSQALGEQSKTALEQLNKEKKAVEEKAKDQFVKTGVRTSLASLLLSVAYTVIGWTGLRRLLF